MRIAVVGTGYVGLVTGACFAETGNQVTCVDIDRRKIEMLNRGEIPIYEPGLSELVTRGIEDDRLRFTTDLNNAVRTAHMVLLAVGTPASKEGLPDLSSMWNVVDAMAPHLPPKVVVVIKSTVPVGTNTAMAARLKAATGRDVIVANNPEFLKEGAAIEDFMKPDRVVIGVARPQDAEPLRELYSPFLRTEKPFLVMSPESAEMTKYVANALLATKISFINEVANLCQRMHADVNDVRRGIGHDSRLGFAFLFPGVGFGGSCFPKDLLALSAMARSMDIEPRILDAVQEVNRDQKTILLAPLEHHFGGKLAGHTIAIWGLSFKPRTDDIREAPALALVDRLLAAGAKLKVHDPEALEAVKAQYGERLSYAVEKEDALTDAEALVIMTEWKEFVHADFEEMKRLMKAPVIFDGRNIYNPGVVKAAGFVYHSIGRPSVDGSKS